jgi:hypothetical protein
MSLVPESDVPHNRCYFTLQFTNIITESSNINQSVQTVLCNLLKNLCKLLLSPWSDQKFGILATELNKKKKNKKGP